MTSSSHPAKPTVYLVGPPNVGKSVLFNRLTGFHVSMANYPGTTVEYTKGRLQLGTQSITLIDTPGTYTLDATNEAERVTTELLSKTPALVISVLDASNLESSLYLLLQVLERQLPTLVVINRMDLLRDKGFGIDLKTFEALLGVPVVSTIATSGQGMEVLQEMILEGLIGKFERPISLETNWQVAEELVEKVKIPLATPANNFRQRLGDWLMKPWPGLPLTFGVLILALALLIGLGMGLRRWVLLPIFEAFVFPLVASAIMWVVPPGSIQEVIIGEYGFLSKGLEWPFTLVLPYVISFYLVLSLLEDSGYMPRLGVLLDGLLAKVGLSGSGIIPLLLGYGCGIPAIMASRTLESSKQRMMVAFMVSLSVPCIAQSGAFISLLAERSIGALLAVIALSMIVLVLAGLGLDRVISGRRPMTVMEIPELLIPKPDFILKKIWVRIRHFLKDGAMPMIAAVGLAAVLYETGIMVHIARVLRPLVTGWLLLPEEAAAPLLLGIFRRELAVLPLLDMNLSSLQLFVGAVVGLFYVPCIAMVAVLSREFGLRFGLMVLIGTTSFAFLIGGILARLGGVIF